MLEICHIFTVQKGLGFFFASTHIFCSEVDDLLCRLDFY